MFVEGKLQKKRKKANCLFNLAGFDKSFESTHRVTLIKWSERYDLKPWAPFIKISAGDKYCTKF